MNIFGKKYDISQKQLSIRSRGQMLMYFILMTMVIVMCEIMIMNIGKLLRDRMVLQNAADSAAMAAAVHQARTMNDLAYLNLQIASLLADSNFFYPTPAPRLPAVAFSGSPLGYGMQGGLQDGNLIGVGGGVCGCSFDMCSKPAVCGVLPLSFQAWKNDISGVTASLDVYPMGTKDTCGWPGSVCSFCECFPISDKQYKQFTDLTKTTFDLMVSNSEAIAKVGPLYSALIAYKVAERAEYGPDGKDAPWGPGKTSTVITGLGLGLQRNKQKITWYAAHHNYGTCILPCCCGTFCACGVFSCIHYHYVTVGDSLGESEKSWYIKEGDSDEDANSGTVSVTCTRGPGEISNAPYPLGALFKITWPTIYVKATAMWLHNKGNIGFPVHQSPFEDKEIWGDRLKSPIQAYVGNDKPTDWTASDGYEGSRWFAKLIKNENFTH